MTAPPIPVDPLEVLPSNALRTPQIQNQLPYQPPTQMQGRPEDSGFPRAQYHEAHLTTQLGQRGPERYREAPVSNDNGRDPGGSEPPQTRPQRTQGYTNSVIPRGPQGPVPGMPSSEGFNSHTSARNAGRAAPSSTARRSNGPYQDFRTQSASAGRSHYQGPSATGHPNDTYGARLPDPPSSGDLPSMGRVHAPISSVPRPPTADAYLERIPNDPRLQQLLNGAASGTIPTAVPPLSAGFGSGPGSSFGNGSDKPLPDPRNPSRARSGYDARSRGPARTQSGMLSTTSGSQRGGGRQHRQGRGTELSQENRYPAFSAGHGPDLLQNSVPVFENPPGARSGTVPRQFSGMQQRAAMQTLGNVGPRTIELPE